MLAYPSAPAPAPASAPSGSRPRRVQVGMYGELTWSEEYTHHPAPRDRRHHRPGHSLSSLSSSSSSLSTSSLDGRLASISETVPLPERTYTYSTRRLPPLEALAHFDNDMELATAPRPPRSSSMHIPRLVARPPAIQTPEFTPSASPSPQTSPAPSLEKDCSPSRKPF